MIPMLCISYDIVYRLLYLVLHIFDDLYIYILLVDRRVWWYYSWCIGTEPFYPEEETTEEIQTDQSDDLLDYCTDGIV